MTDIQPRFFEKENKLIAHLEWEAIRILCFDGSHMNIADAYPKFEQRRFYWTQKYYDKATDEYHSIKRKITNKEYQSLDEFYADLKPILKPKPRGNMLKDKKKRTSHVNVANITRIDHIAGPLTKKKQLHLRLNIQVHRSETFFKHFELHFDFNISSSHRTL